MEVAHYFPKLRDDVLPVQEKRPGCKDFVHLFLQPGLVVLEEAFPEGFGNDPVGLEVMLVDFLFNSYALNKVPLQGREAHLLPPLLAHSRWGCLPLYKHLLEQHAYVRFLRLPLHLCHRFVNLPDVKELSRHDAQLVDHYAHSQHERHHHHCTEVCETVVIDV